jgi:hypothetical protein
LGRIRAAWGFEVTVTPLAVSPSPPDLEYWARIPGWKADEAAALMLGLDPEAAEFTETDRARIRRLKRMLKRASRMELLSIPTPPRDLLEWARSNGLPIPDALKVAVGKGRSLRNWRKRSRKYKAELKKLKEQSQDVDLKKKSKKSLYRILLAVAMQKYGYRHGKNNSAASAIETALVSQGFNKPPTQETIRNWLDTAFEEVGSEIEN